ncbi:hypothetical protein HanRHA438_Chr01g0021931 [Helianthus annuus]|nr:hypothetical protein HanRHA438_Chr01g0021931 [Helianthus annuus]
MKNSSQPPYSSPSSSSIFISTSTSFPDLSCELIRSWIALSSFRLNQVPFAISLFFIHVLKTSGTKHESFCMSFVTKSDAFCSIRN